MSAFASFTPQDRGLAYGDGLFETMRLSRGRLLWWSEHRARLSYTSCRLGLPPPDIPAVRAAIEAAVMQSGRADAVVKLIYTAGSGQRGYHRTQPLEPALTVLIGEPPVPVPHGSVQGLTLGLMRQDGGEPPTALRGLKHLNRLPQVLARDAWPAGVDECLIQDARGLVAGGTQSNFYWLEAGHWFTPPILGSGIAGIARAVLCRALPVTIAPLSIGRLALAQAAALSNVVRGVRPVASLNGRVLPVEPARELAENWQRLCDEQGVDPAHPGHSAWFACQRQEDLLDPRCHDLSLELLMADPFNNPDTPPTSVRRAS